MKLNNPIYINKNLNTSIKKITADLIKKKINRYCFHKKHSKKGQFMIIYRPKGLFYSEITADRSFRFIIKGEMRFKYKDKNLLLKNNQFVFLKKNVHYENLAIKDTILLEFKSSCFK